MPVNVVWQLASLLGDLVNIILSEMPLASLIRSLQVLHALRLAHGQEEAMRSELADSLGQPDQVGLDLGL